MQTPRMYGRMLPRRAIRDFSYASNGDPAICRTVIDSKVKIEMSESTPPEIKMFMIL